MPISLPDHQRYLDLARRLVSTVVSDPNRHPMIVYRGEHGTSTEPVHSPNRAISFGTAVAASSYAISPNNRSDMPAAPRVMAAYLSIAKPVIDNRDDPFIEMGTILEKLGRDKTERIARRFAGHIENTGNWVDGFAHDFESVEQLLDLEPERLSELYLDAYPVFDDDEVVGWFADAGYDGAIHLGNGETALEEEFKVFDRSQIHFAIGIDDKALAQAIAVVHAQTFEHAPVLGDRTALNDITSRKDQNMTQRTLLQFQSNYRGQADYLVMAGPLAGKRISYRYMPREFYEKDYTDYGARAWRGDPTSYRREVLSSVGLVCCNSEPVPQEIVDEVNKLAMLWRENDPELSPEPARAGVYVAGHGWTEVVHVVLEFRDHVEHFTSVPAAEQALRHPSSAWPSRAWEEGAAGEVVREFSPALADSQLVLVSPGDETTEAEEDVVAAPSY
jgi:hypothetical protein